MAYYTSTVATLADLLANLRAHCVSEGWLLAGDILHKGTCQLEINITSNLIRIRGGTGRSGNALTGAAPFYGYLGTSSQTTTATVLRLIFPVVYELYVFDDPKEVYLVAHQGDQGVQILAFGQSAEPGLPGNGTWFYGTMGQGTAVQFSNATPIYSVPGYAGFSGNSTLNNGAWPCILDQHGGSGVASCSIHHDYDGVGWAPVPSSGERTNWATNGVTGWLRFQDPLLQRQPSGLGDASPLVPLDVFCGRPQGNITPVVGLKNIRAVRIDNLQDGQIISFGPERWKIHPWFKRDAAARNGSVLGATHSGTMGWALRYEGP